MQQIDNPIEAVFSQLATSQRAEIIYHGALLRLSELNKQLFLAKSKVRDFESKYHTSLSILDAEGLPDDASFEMHEDYILWHHWVDSMEHAIQQIHSLEPIILQRPPLAGAVDASK